MATKNLYAQISPRLWGNQKAAVDTVVRYIAAYKKGKTTRAALVQAPTGTGKTGTIAMLARVRAEVGTVLVVSPRIALREQLARDIRHDFFADIKVDASTLPKNVLEFVQRDLPTDLANIVIVTTIQKLERMVRRKDPELQRLAAAVDLLLFDEGHYEPATTWNDVVRSFPCPRVLFTATPFRNDLKLFDVDPAHVSTFTFQAALDDGLLRLPRFVSGAANPTPAQFVRDVIAAYGTNVGPEPRDDARIIVRCDRAESIRAIARAFADEGWKSVAIHETFEERPTLGEFRRVPDPSTRAEIVWIHQFKLLEGIDDRRFRVLALYEPLSNVRALVQQIGRVLRNPDREPNAEAYVLDHFNGGIEKGWENYRDYDRALADAGITAVHGGYETLFENINAQLPELIYLDGQFRKKLDLAALRLGSSSELRIPRSVRVFEKPDGFDLATAVSVLDTAARDEDRMVLTHVTDAETCIMTYVVLRNSPFLSESVFLEPVFGVTVLRVSERFVFYYDAQGSTPPDRLKLDDVAGVEQLKRLFSVGQKAQLTSITLENANLNPFAVRSRSFSAADVAVTPELLEDHQYICKNVLGYNIVDAGGRRTRVRRYVGISRGRISDESAEYVPLDEYRAWLDAVAGELQSKRRPVDVFERYADSTRRPAAAKAAHVVIDFDEARELYVTTGVDDMPAGVLFKAPDTAGSIENGSFTFEANGMEHVVTVPYDSDTGRFQVKSADLGRRYRHRDERDHRGLPGFINASQAFRVVTEDGICYSGGTFYEPSPDLDRVLKILVPIKGLDAVATEKGRPGSATNTTWEDGSVFRLLSDCGGTTDLAAHMRDLDVLVCDDLQDESADFIAARAASIGRPPFVAYIHAKAAATASYVSASNLHEVAKQADKNVGELMLFASARDDRASKWGKAWKDGRVGTVTKRIRIGGSPTKAWNSVRSIVEDPTAEREVWIVVGQTLSAAKFAKDLKKETPVAIQVAYLLLTTLASAASAGARLKVFCSP